MTIEIKLTGAAEVRKQLKVVPKELRSALRAEVKTLGASLVSEMRERSSWSTRIPRAINVQIKYGRTAGVIVRVNDRTAPHAYLYEQAKFRHPLFGDREHWYAYPNPKIARPARQFFYISARGKMDELRMATQAALVAALK
jgi:hypothetical protein